MKAYIELDNNIVCAYATYNVNGEFIEVEQEDSIINFNKLQGYYIVFEDEVNKLKFDESKYQAYLDEQKRQQAIQEGEKLANELANKSLLVNATDEQAYIMRYKYEEWAPKTKYEVGDRKRYGDILYKCKQEHTSEEGPNRTPDKLPALWDAINDDESKGTLENPIPVQDPFSSMTYVKGKYYIEDGKIYLMSRDGMEDGEEISLTYKPSQLVGHYFTLIE